MEKYNSFISKWITTLHILLTVGLTTGLVVSFHAGNIYLIYALYVFNILSWTWIILKSRKMISNLIQDKAHWQYAATYDSLTGTLNRGIFLQNVAKEIQRSLRYKAQMSFAILDIDDFKNVNDSYGHDVGDDVLVKLSDTLRDTLRDADDVGRIGGEEFGILLPETDLEQAKNTCERIRNIVSEMIAEGSTNITVSIGITSLGEGDTLDKMYKRADKALYISKHGGRNKVSTS